jgi:excisionase family DNA binding protein
MTTSLPEPRWVGVAEAAKYAGCSERTIRRWVHKRLLPATRVGPRRIEIDLNDLDKMRTPIGETEARPA